MGQAPIRELCTSVGVKVSKGYLAALLTNTADFAPEAQALGVAGLVCDGYAPIDVTPTRVAGVEQECHVLGNTAFVFYHTDLFRDRQAALRTLQLGAVSTFDGQRCCLDLPFSGRDAGRKHAYGAGDAAGGPALHPA